MLTDFSPNIPKFFCGFCGIKTDNKKDFNKHLLTAKHKKNENLTNIEHISPKNPITHTCKKCNKLYKSRVGLWYHEKKCDNKNNNLINESNIENVNQEITPLMILSVIQQNQEFKNLLMDESMGASTEEEKKENINKIITKIAKEVVIEKESE